jgi:hypothetical protein
MVRLAKILIAASAALAFMPFVATSARARVKSGTLICDVSAGLGMIIASKQAVLCTFKSARGFRETYSGTFTTVGIDIGVTSAKTIVWAVFEPTRIHNSLAGTYVGATAQATVVAGLGANVLVGGSRNSIALQPLSVSGQTGLNIAAGVGGLTLQRQG